ncbi:conserved hypothetical protein [Talaromyces stipitatus ATCC 10500]|uniref:Uncharacterized protein n=1 Tax=Talaromyces stipitatus (strain ATCC 10500 / CBS 375.48 / QM 6759 / NRRL 1006) TaxID=441959 RepID=B8MA36_TALSN|nr:uncharacterized protein TSTA_121090 [Talaromyces stipitatus ATCC 10500]EED18365.1 conserved hypothetical protein [Talaromyces stipitatus ATCC 10500]
MAYTDEKLHNLEENIEPIYAKHSQHRRSKIFLIALLGGTITFYSLFGIILLCFYSDATLLALITNPHFNHKYNHLQNQWINTKSSIALDEKPRGVNIAAVVEYRNWERSSILNCYLRRNLVEYGGLLDEVVFIPETTDREHLEWLYETVNKSESYSIRPYFFPAADTKDIYIKIDGDVVYIEDNVIPTIINTKLQHPETGIVSANVIHQPAVAEFHRRAGVVLPQLLDIKSLSQDSKTSGRNWIPFLSYWRNMLESWFCQQRPAPSSSSSIYLVSNSASATEQYTWLSQAQQHNSFLHHLERDELQSYKFPLWKNPPGEISGAFVVLPGNSNASNINSSTLSQQRDVLIDGKGVVSHYDDAAGKEGLDVTNILNRYRKYAEDHACFAD